MVKMMHRLRLITVLLSPSIVSGSLTLLLALVAIGRETWAYIYHEQLFYDFLFGAYGLRTGMLQTDNTTIFHDLLFGDMVMYQLLLVLCAIVVGCLVYALMRVLSGIISGWSTLLAEIRSHDKVSRAMLASNLARLGMRTSSIIAWAVYTFVFIGIPLPFCTLLTQNGIDLITTNTLVGGLYIVGAVVFLALCLHLHVTFMRLTFLRLRLFGGLEAELYVSQNNPNV